MTYIRKGCYEVMDVGGAGCSDHFVHGDLATVVSILYVLTDTAVKEDGLLGHKTDLRPQPFDVQRLDVHAVKGLKRKETK